MCSSDLGKTTVAEIFKSKNIPIIDTDIIAREIVEYGKPAYTEVIKLFGEEILNKNKDIDRRALRKLIFSSEKKRLQLESILHPIIWDAVKSQLALITTSTSTLPPYCIIVIPLLLENSSETKPVTFDRILVIDVAEEIQIKRTLKRDNSDISMIKNIIKSQVTRQVRIDAANDIILNSNGLDLLNIKVDNLHKQYLDLSK